MTVRVAVVVVLSLTLFTVCLSAALREVVEPTGTTVALAVATVAPVTVPVGVEAAAVVALALRPPVQETQQARAALEKETTTGLEAPCITGAVEVAAFDAPIQGG
jgi:hypothetical protein